MKINIKPNNKHIMTIDNVPEGLNYRVVCGCEGIKTTYSNVPYLRLYRQCTGHNRAFMGFHMHRSVIRV